MRAKSQSMRPVAIFRFSPTEGPAHFAEWLDANGVRFELIKIDSGESIPADPHAFAGIGLMGGPMGVSALPRSNGITTLSICRPVRHACSPIDSIRIRRM